MIKNAETAKRRRKKKVHGWVCLSVDGRDIYLNIDKIVCVGNRVGDYTYIYTVGAEDDPWTVNETPDVVMALIDDAQQEAENGSMA